MSVILASQGTVERALEGHDGFSLVAIRMSVARELGLGIVRDPLPTEPAHAKLFGRKTSSVRRRLAKQSQWVVLAARKPG